MREKRRSTGVVYLGCQANDSNGTTTGEEEEEDEEEVVVVDEETVKNTKQNEISNTDGNYGFTKILYFAIVSSRRRTIQARTEQQIQN